MTDTTTTPRPGGNRKLLRKLNVLRWRDRAPVVPVVRLSGAIGSGVTPLRPSLTLAGVASALQKAFSYSRAPGVAIAINSPGGSPVQSRLIYNRIRALAEEKEKTVFVFCEDAAASGGYLIALAGDEIYADDSSIVGSIGVVSAGFGFDKAIGKIGVERRVYTSGKSKHSLDPFQPERAEDVKRLKAIQKDVHEAFIALVRERRGDRLKGKDAQLFNGEFWSGRGALELGLVDGLGDMRAVLREKFGDELKMKLVSPGGGWLPRRLVANRLHGGLPQSALPAGWADELVAALEARALWARYGL